jgi:hypothetical protein
VGVLEIGPPLVVAHEAYVNGTTVAALGANPARKGWTLCAASAEGNVSLLRLAADPALPRGWNPLGSAPEPPPAPAPETAPGPRRPAEAGARPACAVLPRAQAAPGGAVDTEIVLINLGQQPQQVFVRFIADEGRSGLVRVTVEPGKRAKVSAAQSLFRRRLATAAFDGYVRIDGGDRETLVVDAVIRRQGEPPEEVRPHWR